MHLLFITFGDSKAVHLQAAFSICSFLAAGKCVSSINVVTDTPAYYKHLQEKINLIPVDQTQLEEWKGPHGFFWRIKIKAIEKLCSLYNNQPVMYLDADTFLYSSILPLQHLLSTRALMHTNEGALSGATLKTEKKMWQQLKQKTFAGIDMLPGDCMWNAGVVATPNNCDNQEMRLALQLCDEMCARGVTRRLIEQHALSLALQKMYGLQPAEPFIAHYWANKEEWNQVIAAFFITASFKRYTIDETVDNIREFDFRSIPVTKDVRNTNTRLHRFIDKRFPPKNISFVGNKI